MNKILWSQTDSSINRFRALLKKSVWGLLFSALTLLLFGCASTTNTLNIIPPDKVTIVFSRAIIDYRTLQSRQLNMECYVHFEHDQSPRQIYELRVDGNRIHDFAYGYESWTIPMDEGNYTFKLDPIYKIPNEEMFQRHLIIKKGSLVVCPVRIIFTVKDPSNSLGYPDFTVDFKLLSDQEEASIWDYCYREFSAPRSPNFSN